MFTSPSAPPGTPALEAFEKAYTAAYQTTKDKLFIQQVYDATFIAALAIQKAGSTDRKTIRDALRDVGSPGGEVVGPGDWKKAVDLIAAGKKIDLSRPPAATASSTRTAMSPASSAIS